MAARSASQEIAVREHQIDLWEEKLTQRAQALADAGRTLNQHRTGLQQVVAKLQAVGLPAPRGTRETLAAEPLAASGKLRDSMAQAEEARRLAVEARMRVAQQWEEELTRQTSALNAVGESVAQLHAQATQSLAEAEATRARALTPVEEPVALTNPSKTPRATPPPPPRPAPAPSRTPVGGPHNRGFARAKVRVQVDFESDHNFFTGFSSDISEGGLFIATVNVQPLGSPVEVAFALPSGEQVMARGLVKWVREPTGDHLHPGMGIQFEGLTEDAREAVHRFIEQRDPIFYSE